MLTRKFPTRGTKIIYELSKIRDYEKKLQKLNFKGISLSLGALFGQNGHSGLLWLSVKGKQTHAEQLSCYHKEGRKAKRAQRYHFGLD